MEKTKTTITEIKDTAEKYNITVEELACLLIDFIDSKREAASALVYLKNHTE